MTGHPREGVAYGRRLTAKEHAVIVRRNIWLLVWVAKLHEMQGHEAIAKVFLYIGLQNYIHAVAHRRDMNRRMVTGKRVYLLRNSKWIREIK